MSMFPSESFAKRIKQEFPVGTRIRLIRMNDDPTPVPPDTKGTVICVDDIGSIGMIWDNGQSLSLIPGTDEYEKITEK